MKLSSLLNENLILWDFAATKREDIYTAVSKLVAQQFNLSQQSLLQAFNARDELGHIVLGDGFLVPHARVDGLDDMIIAVVKLAEPVDIDGQQADFFFALLTGKIGSNLYLKTQAALAGIILQHGTDLKKIAAGADFYQYVQELSWDLGEHLTAGHIMTTPAVTITPQSTLSAALDLMKKNNVTFLPVVDDTNHYLGKIDLLDILGLVYPEYLVHMSNLSFLNELRAFETLAEREATTTVQQVFVAGNQKVVNTNTNVIGLGFTFLKNHWHHVTVLDENGCVAGVIGLINILHNVVRI